ncbi:MAG: helix-turn-helix transcriptional regulator [Chloroflexota bacterium]
MTIKNKLRLLIADKEYRENRKISYRTVAQEADIPLSVLTDYTSQKVKRFDVKTLEKLCRYFDCQPGDLLEYVPDEEEPKDKKTAR